MSTTIQERDMLKTAVPERDMCVTTALVPTGCARPWTAVFAGQGQKTRTVWLQFWRGPVTPGGLAEAHERVVEQVQRGEIPAQGSDREAWGALADRRVDDPVPDDRIRAARGGALPIQGEEAP